MNIAQSSLEEVRYYIILSYDLKYNKSLDEIEQIEEISKMLSSYSNKIQERS